MVIGIFFRGPCLHCLLFSFIVHEEVDTLAAAAAAIHRRCFRTQIDVFFAVVVMAIRSSLSELVACVRCEALNLGATIDRRRSLHHCGAG